MLLVRAYYVFDAGTGINTECVISPHRKKKDQVETLGCGPYDIPCVAIVSALVLLVSVGWDWTALSNRFLMFMF